MTHMLRTAALPVLALAFLLGACTTVDEGPTGNRVAHRPPQPDLPPEVEAPQPQSRSPEYQGKEAFNATEIVEERTRQTQPPPGSQVLTLRMGEQREVYRQTWHLGETQYAFYLPAEATNVVKLIVETDNLTHRTYFIRAIGYGDTVGGIVRKDQLDETGFHPRNAADFGRIQEAIRQKPVFISVKE